MIKDEFLMKAVSKIRYRSEKQDDLQKLNATFFDVGILHQLDNDAVSATTPVPLI